jgi:hypothetical protein
MVTRSPFGKGEIMSLKGKAKTLVEIIKETCSYVYITRCKDCIGQCEFEGTESFAGLWVRLEDAEKEIKEKSKNYAKLCARLHEQVIDLTLKDKELKQKLQQLLNDFPKSEFVTMGNLKAISSTFKGEEVQNWKKKFEELLKKEKEAKL